MAIIPSIKPVIRFQEQLFFASWLFLLNELKKSSFKTGLHLLKFSFSHIRVIFDDPKHLIETKSKNRRSPSGEKYVFAALHLLVLAILKLQLSKKTTPEWNITIKF